MNYYLFVSIILMSVYGLFSLTRQLQMLQQNSYFPSRYLGWLKANLPVNSTLLFVIFTLLASFKLHIPLLVYSLLLFIGVIFNTLRIQKKSIKRLVFTGRIKRLYFAAALILALLILTCALLKGKYIGALLGSVTLCFSFITPLLVLMAWAVTYPVERLFSKWYVSDAKKKLKAHKDLKVIGITGSYGKTTTKFILTRILSEKYNTLCTPQSFNTPMGVVRTIRESLKPQTQIFVCEMGAKNKGDIKEICDIVNPHYGIITSVGPQHLETFKSVDNVFLTKLELARAVIQKKGKVFLNGDSKEIISRINERDYILYGTDLSFNYPAFNITYNRFGSSFEVMLGDEKVKLTSKLLGLHSIINIVGAAALSYELGVSPDEIKYAVSTLKPTEHRLEMKAGIKSSVMIDDAYNANPEGSLEAVNVLASFEGMKKVIITPGLIELGQKEYESNYNLGLAAAKKCDIIIFVGQKRSKPMVDAVNTTSFNKENLFIASSFKEAMEIYSRFADQNSVVLLENDLPDNYLE